MKKSLYEKLGVKKGASQKEIKEAYREKAKQSHPDKGGDKKDMAEINHCYSILINPEKRKRYDESGDERPETTFENRLYAFVNQIFIRAIQEVKDVSKVDMVDLLKNNVAANLNEFHKQSKQTKQFLSKTKSTKERLTTKGNTIIISVLDANIENLSLEVNRIKNEIDFLNKAIEVLSDYNYKFEVPDEISFGNTFAGFTFNV